MKTKSKKATYTPGPWEVDSGCVGFDQTAISALRRGKKVFVVDRIYNDYSNLELAESEANARLIASAPELLEAVKELLSAIRLNVNTDEMSCLGDEMEKLESAIAKAEGN